MKPSELEMQILALLWERGPSTAREVLKNMPDGKERADTSILSLWQAGLVWLGLHLLLRTVPASAVTVRYRLGLAGVCLVTINWLVTWSWLSCEAETARQIAFAFSASTAHPGEVPPPIAIPH